MKKKNYDNHVESWKRMRDNDLTAMMLRLKRGYRDPSAYKRSDGKPINSKGHNRR